MGNRIGVIFHEDWNDFSPLLYSHYGADFIPLKIQEYIREYYEKYDINNHDGHEYDPCHMMAGFIKFLDVDTHMRIQNLDRSQINKIQNKHEYPNCFEGGCWIINVSRKNYGRTTGNTNYSLENNNIYTGNFIYTDNFIYNYLLPNSKLTKEELGDDFINAISETLEEMILEEIKSLELKYPTNKDKIMEELKTKFKYFCDITEIK